jgi:DNA-binding transcriptional MerR regulator
MGRKNDSCPNPMDLTLLPENVDLTPALPAADNITIGRLSREAGVTLRTLRFYQSKGLLAPQRIGNGRVFSGEDRERLGLIQQGKRLGFTLSEIRSMLAARARGNDRALPISRKKCVEQIALLERQRREVDAALSELRQIYTGMFITSAVSRATREPVSGPL